jgi:uncharacterized RDD family membrane protein YckC
MTSRIKYANTYQRFFASLIDGIIFIPFAFLDAYLVDTNNLLIIIPWLIAYDVINFIYSIICNYKFGQTIGKIMMGIMVVDASESKSLTLKQAFLRDSILILICSTSLLFHISIFIINGRYSEELLDNYFLIEAGIALGWVLLELIVMQTNPKRKAIHDYIANTVVIDLENKNSIEEVLVK